MGVAAEEIQKKKRKYKRQYSKNLVEMDRTYESFEWLLRDKVEQLDHLMFKLHQEARTVGVDNLYIGEYMRDKMCKLIDEVAAKREEEERVSRQRRVLDVL